MALNLVGFDSAWADDPSRPGAICALRADGGAVRFDPPQLAGFDTAEAFIRKRHRDGDLTIVAIDQPTIVRNAAGARPVDRAVASLTSWSGGGIQPAFRGKTGMFGDGAPIWRFLDRLRFDDDPDRGCRATSGGFVMEVFPALALLARDPQFTAGPRCGPRYNPSRKTFRLPDWVAVCAVASAEARRLGIEEAALWCDALDRSTRPRKGIQDRLDALICLLIARRWHAERDTCLMIGDLAHGYIVAPVSPTTRSRLLRAAAERGVPAA